VRLLRDEAAAVRQAEAARALVVDHYSWARQAERLLELYRR
jgi:glycosyltransferase involved in cell wall biosynthesis